MYYCFHFFQCCPLCSGPRAYEVTLEVHMTGAGTVAVANKKIVDEVRIINDNLKQDFLFFAV